MYVRRVHSPAQQDRALALSRKHVCSRAARMGVILLSQACAAEPHPYRAVCGRAATPPHSGRYITWLSLDKY